MSILSENDVLVGAKGGGSAPRMSEAEQQAIGKQTDIADWQWQVAQDQYNAQNAMLPFYLEEAGYDYKPIERKPEHTSLLQQQQELTALRGKEQWTPEEMQAMDARLAEIDKQLGYYTAAEAKPGGHTVEYGGQAYNLRKRADPLEAINKENALLAAQRSQKALKGELDVDPAVQQDLARQKEVLHEELLRRLGPGYQNTDSGQRALAELDRNANMVNYQVRHGELSAAQAVQSVAENAYRGNRVQNQASLQGFSHFPSSAAATAGGAAQGFGQISNQLGNQRMQQYNQQSQNAAAQGQMWGSLAGGGMGLAGAGMMAYAV